METRQPVPDDEIDLRRLFATLWHHRWTIVAVTVAAALVAATLSLFVIPPTYESRTDIQLSAHSSEVYASAAAASRVLTSLSFLEPIARAHGITETGHRLERLVRAEPLRDTRIVRLRVRDGDPQRLRAFSDGIVREFLRRASVRVEQRRQLAESRLQTVRAQAADVEATVLQSLQVLARLQQDRALSGAEAGFVQSFTLNALGVSEGMYSSLLDAERNLRAELVALDPPVLVQEPFIPEQPVSPRPVLNTAIAAMLGLMVGTMWVLIRGSLGTTPTAGTQAGTVRRAAVASEPGP
jgi:capsular polysaccharide biosynthesis protein